MIKFKDFLNEEMEIPTSHIGKHEKMGRDIHHRILHNGKDTPHGKITDLSVGREKARKYKSKMKRDGYDHTTVKLHHYVSGK